MSRSRLGARAAALVLLLGAAGPLAGCGDDEEEGGNVEATITTEPADETEVLPDDPDGAPPEPDSDAGGTEAPVVPDDAHEGGGPDPGTEEAEQAPGASGGSSSGEDPVELPGGDEDDGTSGGTKPPESFEQFCEENPRACE